MNRIEQFLGLGKEAEIRYLGGEFEVLTRGKFVRCAVTGDAIALEDLKYWSVELQEPYSSASISLARQSDIRKHE